MSKLSILLSEKVVKAIAALLLGEDNLIDARDIEDLCKMFFSDHDPISELHLKTSLYDLQRKFAENIKTILSTAKLSDNQRKAIELAATNAIIQTELSSKHLATLHNDPNKLYNELLENCNDLKSLSEAEESYTKKCLRFVAEEIIVSISQFAVDFTAMNYQQILDEIDNIKMLLAEEMNKMVTALQASDTPISDFHVEYIQAIKRNCGNVELFTSKIDTGFAKSYRLDLAYIELFLKLQDSRHNRTIAVHQLLNQGNKWLILGEAGCGKTTLLNWLALSIASGTLRDKKLQKLEGYFPVIITLRKVKSWDKFGIKQAIEDELIETAAHIPQKIIRGLRQGQVKALLLIDGLDEIDEIKRGMLYRWLFELESERNEGIKKENDSRLLALRQERKDNTLQLPERERLKNELIVLITSRHIISSSILNELKRDLGFKTAYVQPMTYIDVQRFVDYWHNAISYGRNLDINLLQARATQLKGRIGSQESLSRLAQSPLLCAMICALNYKRDGILPTNRLELYDSCSQMLLEDRDNLRSINTEKYRQLNVFEYEDKRRILSDLALWMLESDGALTVDYDSAAKRLESKLTFLNKFNKISSGLDPQQLADLILSYFIERGGILRRIGNGQIGFVHKTFQEYFAAYQVYLGEEWNIIISPSRATDVLWREVILLAVSFSNVKSAEKIINTFLCRSGNRASTDIKKASSKNEQTVYKLLAISCASVARELLPETKGQIDECTISLIPPKTIEVESALVYCGNLVVPLLSYNIAWHNYYVNACARVLLQIGTRQALSQIIEYLDSKSIDVYKDFLNHLPYLSSDIIKESGVVPAYIDAIFSHSVKNNSGQMTLEPAVIHRLARIAPFCSYRFAKERDTYVLSDVMKKRLSRRLARVKKVNIKNFMANLSDDDENNNEAILKILDLFSISKSIDSVVVSYNYDMSKIDTFQQVISQFINLKSLTVHDVSTEIAGEFEKSVRLLGIEKLSIHTLKRKK